MALSIYTGVRDGIASGFHAVLLAMDRAHDAGRCDSDAESHQSELVHQPENDAGCKLRVEPHC